MSQRQVLMILGVWIAVLPFLGFPSGWKEALACFSGLLVVFLAYRFRSAAGAEKSDPAAISYAERKSVPSAAKVPADSTASDGTAITGSANISAQ